MRNPVTHRRTACSILALATALAVGPSPAAAQSYLGTATPLVPGSATITTPGGTTQVDVNNPQTVITWTPNDTATSTSPIVFQNGGTTTNFVMGGNNYAVLNRIIATDQTRQIQFFGTTNSNIGSTTGPVGGSVYFYAPGGFLLGGGSVFNVGSLVLSALPIAFDANGTFITGARNQVVFGQATQPNATIATNSGSQINALGNPGSGTYNNSYVALVAPRVLRGGDIVVNGQAAIVAAEAATIRFSPDGLFDIEVDSGTGQANGITGAGDITGPASADNGDNHRVYMVAVPKNQAMSLALSQGTVLGFDIAQAADVVGNAIVLSAGHDVINGAVQTARSDGGGTGAANIGANAISATSALTARATGEASFFSLAGQASNFASNLTAYGQVLAWGSASGSDSSFNVVGDIILNSDVSASVEGGSATGGWASLYAQNGGFVSIGGNATLSANGYGAGSLGNAVPAGSGTGGRAWIQAEPGSSMFITGAASATADGYGGFASGTGAAGGTGQGGEALIRAFGAGSTLGIDGNATASAHGYGGGAFNGDGGAGNGGDAGIYADVGSLTIDGSLLAITSAYGGDGGGTGNSSGDGTGGDSYVYANGGGALTVAGQLQVASHAFGGVDTSGLAASGAGIAGNSTLYAFAGGDVSSGGLAIVQANGYGGPFGECTGCGGAASFGRGGSAEISASGAGSTLTLAGVSIAAGGTGSNGVVDRGGDGFGGFAEMWANSGASITVNGNASITATGFGGADFGGFGGGDGFGGGYLGYGYAQIATYGINPATSINVTGSISLGAQGSGGNSSTAPGVRIAGDGFGGSAQITSFSGGISAASAAVTANGFGGNATGGTGGSGTGGDASMDAAGGNISIAGAANVTVLGTGGNGAIGGAGNGGGDVLGQFGGAGLYASGAGLLTIGGQATVNARGLGGTGTTLGGAANGGVAQVVAGGGGDIDLLALTRITSDAVAGAGADGRGGVSLAFAGPGSTIDFQSLNLRADGYGGSQIGIDVGDGYGGTARLEASGAGAAITVTLPSNSQSQDTETMSADGFGGDTAIAGGTGGTGFGGTLDLLSNNGALVTMSPVVGTGQSLYFRARGYGGAPDAEGATGGIGDGGVLNLVVDNGTMTLGSSQYSSIGEGGFTELFNINTNGGDGLGGERHITVLNGGVLTATIPGGVAGGIGGAGSGTGSGGDGSGGLATLTVDSSTFNVTGNTTISSQSAGGAAEAGAAGSSLGGQVTTVTLTNATVHVASGSFLFIGANGFGGSADGTGGNGQGGFVTANITNSTINTGSIDVFATGQGGGGDNGGGHGTGGTAIVNLTGSTFNGQAFTVEANGNGGATTSGVAGNGTAGTARLNSVGGINSITSSGQFGVFAEGIGGSVVDGNATTGNGTGGTASIFAGSGSTLNLNGNFIVSAEGDGGSFVTAQGSPSGNGGYGDGGTASIFANNAAVNINGNLLVTGAATGASGIGGHGGNALGGRAALGAVAGAINVSGTTTLDGHATAGSGTVGGNATALISMEEEIDPTAASLYVQDGGSITLAGSVMINVAAAGGNSANGNGGTATAGEVDVVPYVGTLTLGNTLINATALGGSGGLGGNGGNAQGGIVEVAFGLNAATINATTTIGTVDINASAAGGAGGVGTSANSGGNGGAGGSGTGGSIAFQGSAAGGTLNSGNAVLTANGIGGAGGAGGNGDAGTGGNGGAGGVGTGGFILAGTISNSASPNSGGDFDVGNLSVATNGTGGVGGNGGLAGGGDGVGGNGGNAFGGESYFWIRGVDASAGAVTLSANANGGNGGAGSTRGNGGNATTGIVAAESKDRFDHPTQRGNLVANSIVATAVATGGDGAAIGLETIYGGSYFRVLNGDATIGSVSFTIGGDNYTSTANTFDYVSVRDGTANITGGFSFVTEGELTLDANNGSMNAGSITLSAADFVPNPAVLPAPTVTGTYQANSFDISTGQDFITNANLDSVDTLAIVGALTIQAANVSSDADVTLGAGNLIDVGNVVAGGNVDLFAFNVGGTVDVGNINAGGSIDVSADTILGGNMTAVGYIDLFAGGLDTIDVGDLSGAGVYATALGNIFTGNITSTADVALQSFEGAIETGNITAATTVDLDAAGNILFGDASAGDFNFTSGGAVTGADIVAVSHADGEAEGAIQLGDITVTGSPIEGFSVGLKSATSIQVGNVDAFADVGFATFGDLQTGSISAGSLVMALVGGDIQTLGITTDPSGQVYLADSSMFELGVDPLTDEFDPAAVLALDPVATGGSITINGPVSTGLFRAAAGNIFEAGVLGADTLDVLADFIDVGDIFSDTAVVLSADSGISTGNIASDEYVDLFSNLGGISTGNIDSAFDVALVAGGAIETGNINAGTSILLAGLTVDAGDLAAGTSVLISAGGNVTTGDIEAGLGGPVLLGDIGTMDVGPGNSVEIFSDGSIVTQDITTDGYVGLYAADDITAASITAEHDIIALAGGDASFGAITTPERFILAGYSNFDELFFNEEFDPELIFQIFPIDSTGGDAVFAGNSSVGEFQSFVGGDTTIQSLTATGEFGYIGVDTGGLLSINGTVGTVGGYIQLLSADIAIGSEAEIIAPLGINFLSINADGTYIGDNLPGTDGYRLSQAELERVNADAVDFTVLTTRGGAPLMVLGDLEFNVDTSNDEDVIEFGIVGEESEEFEDRTGIIRVVGNVNFTFGSPEMGVEIAAETFEIDAETGSMSLVDSTGNLTGVLHLEVDNIYVASSEILAKLEENPQYEGFREELNAPAAVQRPEGVLRAAVVTLGEDGVSLDNILIQNTGTEETPAGFLISDLTFSDEDEGEGEEGPAPASINMVINGQIETPQGTETGDDVRMAFVEEFGTEIFVEGSTINGCTLTGQCGSFGGGTGSPQEQQPVTPTQIEILTSDPLGESFFGNEGDIAGDGEAAAEDGSSSSPIDAPQPLFDTRPLNADEDVSEPVSGAGNPSLYGVTSDEDDDDDEEDEDGDGKKDEKAKPAGQENGRTGDGK